jgi:sulfonate transport system ATP-binding protein
MQALVKALVRKHQPGVLLVTHDVDEAITLGDRRWSCATGPSREHTTYLYRASGHRSHPEAIELRDRLLADLGVSADV